jgi:hypothetical protein
MRWLVLLATLARTAHADSCVDDGKPYDEAVMRERVARLASPENDGRAPGSKGDIATRAFLVERFSCLGLLPAFDAFEQAFVTDKVKTANVVGYVKGSDADAGILYVTAHHDHLGDGHLGANDNASGIVGLLAIAQAIRQRAQPRRTIVFAAFGAEEGGMIGSYFYAAHPPAALPNDEVVEVINLDMVGTHQSHQLVAAMGAFKGHPARKLLDGLVGKFGKISVASGGIARGSDFEPFCKLGIPYVFFWTPDQRCYHEKCDVAKTLDYKHMVDIVRLAGALTEAMADTQIDLLASRAKTGCGVK